MLLRTLVMTSILLLQACTKLTEHSVVHQSPFVACGAGIQSGISASAAADIRYRSGEAAVTIGESVTSRLDPNSASDSKYGEYVKCILELDRRNRTTSSDFLAIEPLPELQWRMLLDHQLSKGLIPGTLSGACVHGMLKYWGTWANRRGSPYAFFYGATKSAFDEFRQRYESQGYENIVTSTFQDCAGEPRYNGAWLKGH